MAKPPVSESRKKRFVGALQRWLGFISSPRESAGSARHTHASYQAEDPDWPAACGRANFDHRLQNLLNDKGEVAAGGLQILNLEKLRARLGDERDSNIERIHLFVEAVLNKNLGRKDFFIRYDDNNYAVVLPELDATNARLKVVAIADEILAKFFGANRDLADIQLRVGAKAVDGTVSEETRSSADFLFETLKNAEAIDVVERDQAAATFQVAEQAPVSEDTAEGREDHEAEAVFSRLELLLEQALITQRHLQSADSPCDGKTNGHAPAWGVEELTALLHEELTTAQKTIAGFPDADHKILHHLLTQVENVLQTLKKTGYKAEPRVVPGAGQGTVERAGSQSQTANEPVYSYEPILNLKKGYVSTYLCRFDLYRGRKLYRSNDCVPYPYSREFHPTADLLILAQSASVVRALIDDNQPSAVTATVHADTLASSAECQRYLAELSRLPQEVCRLLILEVFGFEKRIWPARIVKSLRLVRQYVRACFARVELDYPHITELENAPLLGVGTTIPHNLSPELLGKRLKMFAAKAHAAQLVSCVGDIRTGQQLEMVHGENILFARGLCVGRPMRYPVGVLPYVDFVSRYDH